jgi:hypothetical protein
MVTSWSVSWSLYGGCGSREEIFLFLWLVHGQGDFSFRFFLLMFELFLVAHNFKSKIYHFNDEHVELKITKIS